MIEAGGIIIPLPFTIGGGALLVLAIIGGVVWLLETGAKGRRHLAKRAEADRLRRELNDKPASSNLPYGLSQTPSDPSPPSPDERE